MPHLLKSHSQTIRETVGRAPIHPFPARMAPGIALDALGHSGRPLKILDPMAGSGTVIAVARAKGHKAYGADIDPLAVLMARVWTRSIEKDRVLSKAEEVLYRARKLFAQLPVSGAYPPGSNETTRKFIRYWFDPHSRRQLAALASAIGRVRDKHLREVLWCAYSRLIITKSSGASLAMDLSHSRPHRKYDRAPSKPFAHFRASVDTVVKNCPQRGRSGLGPAPDVRIGDARALTHKSGSIDLVLTSPPYLNAIDYMRCSKFSLVWMGYSIDRLRALRGESVGAETGLEDASLSVWVGMVIAQVGLTPALSHRDLALLHRYVWDMNLAIQETARVLRPGGRAVYVVGDSTCKGTFISNSRIVSTLASLHGLAAISRVSRALPANRRYMPPPTKGLFSRMDGRMRREVVLAFRKAGTNRRLKCKRASQ